MATTSYTDVRFAGGPHGGQSRRWSGKPDQHLTEHGGRYTYRAGDDEGTGTYTWEPDDSKDDGRVPTDGDDASRLLAEGGVPRTAASSAVVDTSGPSTTIATDGPAPTTSKATTRRGK